MTDARCAPPDGADDGSLHMLTAPDGKIDCGKWRGKGMGWWFGDHVSMTPDAGAELGWHYLCPIPSPTELARLREIEEVARAEQEAAIAIDRAQDNKSTDLASCVLDLHGAIDAWRAARQRLTAALAKEPAHD